MSYVKTHVVARRNARGGRTATEHLVAALRCLYRHAEDDGYITPNENPARKADKPRRLPSTRQAVTDDRLAEICQAAADRGDDPELDTLLLRLHTETACRRGGTIALRPDDLDPAQCLIRLREKGVTVRWQPVSPTLMARLVEHGQERDAPPGGQLLRYRNARPITSRRYDGLWARIGRVLPVGPHPADQHALDPAHHPDVVLKGAELHPMQHSAVRMSTRCLRRSVRPLRCARPAGAPCSYGDLGLHGPPESDATMMQLISLRGLHHHCGCWHPDAPGSSRLRRVHHRPDPASGARPAPQLRRTRRTSASLAAPRVPPGNQPLLLHLMHPRPGRRMFARPASSPVSHPARRRANAPRTRPPRIAAADRPTLLAWTCDTAGQIPTRNHKPWE